MEEICANCGYRGRPYRISGGQVVLGVVLLLIFILPGLIYFGWIAFNHGACPQCKKRDTMETLSSGAGREIQARFQSPAVTPGASGVGGLAEGLRELAALRSEGLVTDSEFEARRAALVARNTA